MVETYTAELQEVDTGKERCFFNVRPHDEEPPLPLDVQLDGNVQRGLTMDTFCNALSNWNKGGFLEGSPLLLHQILQKWLLGNNRRRDHPMQTVVSLLAPAEGGWTLVLMAGLHFDYATWASKPTL